MDYSLVTFANPLAEFLGPILLLLQATGFFEAYVFMPTMTLLAAYLFVELKHKAVSNGSFAMWPWYRRRRLFKVICFSQCFLLTNAAAVALKTMIVEEMDYETYVWFIPYVSPLHIYIVSVVAAHIYLIWTNIRSGLSKALCVYVQAGLFGGYFVCFHRLVNEPFELTDPTTGMSAYFMFAWFGMINLDIVSRLGLLKRDIKRLHPPQSAGGQNASSV